MSINVLQRLIIAALHGFDYTIPGPWTNGTAIAAFEIDVARDLPNIGCLHRQKMLVTFPPHQICNASK